MIVNGIEVPDIDLTSKVKANLDQDVRAAMSVEKDIETLQGAPVIRRTLAQPIPPQASFPKEQGTVNPDKFLVSLTDEEKILYDEYIKMQDQLPLGLTPVKLIEYKRMYGDLYFLQLASGPYLYRALSAKEDKRIKEIKGLTNSAYMNHVISTCVIAPPFTLMEAESSKLAGTKNTLYEQILIYSDFATSDTASIKL